MEHPVGTGYLKALYLFKGSIAPIVVLCVNEDGVVFNRHVLIRRTLILQLLKAVVPAQRREGEALTHRLLLGRVYLGRLVRKDNIVGTYDAAVGDDLCGTELLFAQQGATDAVRIVFVIIRGYLYEVERYLAQSELVAPLTHEQCQAVGILVAGVAHVGAALVEQDALDGVVEDGVEGTVAPEQRTVVVP